MSRLGKPFPKWVGIFPSGFGSLGGVLSNHEVGRRVAAARALADYEGREDFAKDLAMNKFGAGTLKSVENGKRELAPHERNHIAEFCDLPRGFFTVERSELGSASSATSRNIDVEALGERIVDLVQKNLELIEALEAQRREAPTSRTLTSVVSRRFDVPRVWTRDGVPDPTEAEVDAMADEIEQPSVQPPRGERTEAPQPRRKRGA